MNCLIQFQNLLILNRMKFSNNLFKNILIGVLFCANIVLITFIFSHRPHKPPRIVENVELSSASKNKIKDLELDFIQSNKMFRDLMRTKELQMIDAALNQDSVLLKEIYLQQFLLFSSRRKEMHDYFWKLGKELTPNEKKKVFTFLKANSNRTSRP